MIDRIHSGAIRRSPGDQLGHEGELSSFSNYGENNEEEEKSLLKHGQTLTSYSNYQRKVTGIYDAECSILVSVK